MEKMNKKPTIEISQMSTKFETSVIPWKKKRISIISSKLNGLSNVANHDSLSLIYRWAKTD